jgi:hypothetical protein
MKISSIALPGTIGKLADLTAPARSPNRGRFLFCPRSRTPALMSHCILRGAALITVSSRPSPSWGRTLAALSTWRVRSQDAPVVNTGNATRLVRKKRSDGSPFKVREFIPHDSRPPLWGLNHVQTDAFNWCRKIGISEINPQTGRARDMPKSTRMTQLRRGACPASEAGCLLFLTHRPAAKC